MHAITGLGLLVLGCSDPFAFDPTSTQQSVAANEPGDGEEEEEICAASTEWLPVTPSELQAFKPLPHPAGECAFYRGVWQTFLVATQPDASGQPAILSFPNVDTMFTSALQKAPNRAILGGIKQAGTRDIVVDQNGRSLYYGIQANQSFADFLSDNDLDNLDGLLALGADNGPNGRARRLFFPEGMMEFKAAWQDITGLDPADYSTFITATATVPTLSIVGDRIVEDPDNPREVTVALLALHAVFTLPGHPEFIWGTMEHSEGGFDTRAEDLKRDVAPTFFDRNPSATDPNNLSETGIVSMDPHVLYLAGTPANQANVPISEPQLAQTFDAATQTFVGQQTSIYRLFPASKSNTIDADDAISSLNFNMGQLFEQVAPNDNRKFYRLVGAVWMDKPQFFDYDKRLLNDGTNPFVVMNGQAAIDDLTENGSDADSSILAGEDRLSSTAMESFTQAPNSFPNCFACHNTQAITERGIPADMDTGGRVLLQPSLLNVSHILSEFVRVETAE